MTPEPDDPRTFSLQKLQALDDVAQQLAQHPPDQWPDLQAALALSLQIIERNARHLIQQRAERN